MRLAAAFRGSELLARRIEARWRWETGCDGLERALTHTLRHPRLVVALSHSNYLRNVGGTELYLRQEQSFLAEHQLSYVQLSSAGGEGLAEVNVDGRPIGRHHLVDLAAAIARRRAPGQGCVAVHLHHLLGWPVDVLQAFVTSLGAERYRVFLHDYYLLCRNFNLLFGAVSFCAAPPTESTACTICRFGVDRQAHLARVEGLLERLTGAGELELVAPSEVAAELFRARWSPERASKVRVVPHQELVETADPRPRRTHRRPRLGFVGYSESCKGYREWLALSSRPSIGAAYDLFHLGACAEPRSYVRSVEVSFQIDGPDAMRRAFEVHQLDFAFLWSLWPETFSFTCFESMSGAAFILTGPQSGNIAAQVQKTGRGRVFPDLEAVERFLLDPNAVEAARVAMRNMPRVHPVWVKSLSAELNGAA